MNSKSPFTILAIETSCDETACAIVQKFPNENFVRVISETTATSLSKHVETKGIVPEVAAREQLKSILPVIQETLKKLDNRCQISDDSKFTLDRISNKASELQSSKEAKLQSYKVADQKNIITNLEPRTQNLIPDIDFIAVTTGPGLIGSLLVGVETARSLAYAWDKPLIPINHVMAHPYANFIRENVETSIAPNTRHKTLNTKLINRPTDNRQPSFPLLSWVISGGHTDLYYMESHQKITKLGGTVDDSAGECFDKCARVLGYDYPGGPNIEKLASEFRNSKFEIRKLSPLPRPLLHSKDFNLSFSGLKTAFLREFQKQQTLSLEHRTINLALAHELQSAITEIIVKKTQLALEKYPKTKSIIISGGVAANQFLTNALKQLTFDFELKTLNFYSPPLKWCTDNAAMIGAYAAFHTELARDWKEVSVKL